MRKLVDEAEQLRDNGELVEARDLFEQIAKNSPDDSEKFWALANWGYCLGELGDHHKAYGVFQEALTLNSSDLEVQFNLANQETEIGQSQNALERFDFVLNSDPANVKAWIGKGLALNNLEEHDKAADAYLGALKLDLSNWNAKMHLANAYVDSQKYDMAKETLKDLLVEKPGDPYALLCQGRALHNESKFKEAIETYRSAAENGSGPGTTHYNIGLCHLELGDLDAAREEVQILRNLESPLADDLLYHIESEKPHGS